MGNITIKFESSNGILVVNEDGSINEDISSFIEGSWLSDIGKVDVEELDNYCKMQGLKMYEEGDVLDFGWWSKRGKYNKPEKSWRYSTFHSQELSMKAAKKVVDKSFKWIEENRANMINNEVTYINSLMVG